MWEDLQKRISLSLQDEELRMPNPEDLDRYEAETDFVLPRSYRGFALTFGPGILGNNHLFEIYSPGFPNSRVDIAKENHQWKTGSIVACDDTTIAGVYDDVQRIRRLILFCAVRDSGDLFGWDPTDSTFPDDHECGIYFVPSNGGKIERVAKTFREFITDFALGGGYERLAYEEPSIDPDNWNKPVKIGFQQASLGPKYD